MSVAKTLDLMKAVLQSSFNMEVKRLCDDYLSIFTLAASNIRENTGDNVPEATLKMLVCKMMEEVCKKYSMEFPNLVIRCQVYQCGSVVGVSCPMGCFVPNCRLCKATRIASGSFPLERLAYHTSSFTHM